MLSSAAGLILDGGRARRLGGRHKAFLEYEGRTIAARTCELFGRLFEELLVATDRPAPWAPFGARIVRDPVPNAGPLAGIAAGLGETRCERLFVVAGDMPSLSEPLIRDLVARAQRRPGSAIVPRVAGRAEALHAVYPRCLAGPAAKALVSGTRKLTDFLATVKVDWVDEDQLRAVAGAADVRLSFRNVNTPADLPAGGSGIESVIASVDDTDEG